MSSPFGGLDSSPCDNDFVMKTRAQSRKSSTEPEVRPRLLSIREASVYLGATIWAVRELVWSRRVPHLKIGRRFLFDIADLDRFITVEKVGAIS